jgi:hypothetical protein
MVAFQFHLQSGKQKKVMWVRDDSHVVVEMVWCHYATASSSVAKVWDAVFTHFHANITVVQGIDCLACQDEFFVNNPLDIKENDEYALDFVLHLSCLFLASVSMDFTLSSPSTCLIITRVSTAPFLRCLQNLVLFLCWIHCESHHITSHNSK